MNDIDKLRADLEGLFEMTDGGWMPKMIYMEALKRVEKIERSHLKVVVNPAPI